MALMCVRPCAPRLCRPVARYPYLGARRVRLFALMPSVGWRASAAGATWRSLTASAPWAVRNGHTTVVDAAGAIYVIGGYNGNIYFNDVWVSTDGGAHQTRQCWGTLWGTKGILWGTKGVLGVLG